MNSQIQRSCRRLALFVHGKLVLYGGGANIAILCGSGDGFLPSGICTGVRHSRLPTGSRSRSGNVLVCNAALFYSRNGCLLAGASDFCFDFQGQRSKRWRAGEDTSSQTGGNSGFIDPIARTNRTIICIKSIMKYSESCHNLRTYWKWIFLLDNFFKKCYDESWLVYPN